MYYRIYVDCLLYSKKIPEQISMHAEVCSKRVIEDMETRCINWALGGVGGYFVKHCLSSSTNFIYLVCKSYWHGEFG